MTTPHTEQLTPRPAFAADTPAADPYAASGADPYAAAAAERERREAAAAAAATPPPAPEPAAAPTEVSGEVVVPGGDAVENAWPHEVIDFHGMRVEVRKPTQAAMGAFSLASSDYIAQKIKNDMTGLFVARHLSPRSYADIMTRLVDPDEAVLTVESLGELMREIVQLFVDDQNAQAEAEKRAKAAAEL